MFQLAGRSGTSLQTAQMGMFSAPSSLYSGWNDVGDQTKALLLNEEGLKEVCKQRISCERDRGGEREESE